MAEFQSRKAYADEIERLGGHLRDTSITILTRPVQAELAGFVCSFIRYQATQAFRIAEWLRRDHNEDVDLIAHATRGLFESNLIYGHLMKGGGRHFMERLVEETSADYFDLLKSVVGDESNLPNVDSAIAEQFRNMKAKRLRKTPRVADLAEENGAMAEYRAFYAHYSKYSHPSLYQIAGDYREVFSQQAAALFASRAVEYLRAIAEDTDQIKDTVVGDNQEQPGPPPA